MPVSEMEVAALRAQLQGDFEEFRRLASKVRAAGGDSGYGAMVSGACFEAIHRRFGTDWTESDIVVFVGQMRSRGININSLDSTTAERVIIHVLGAGESDAIGDIDGNLVFQIQFVTLLTLVRDERFAEQALEEFLAAARETADGLLRLPADG